ncbi:hypothetical protein [Streptomyces sp. NBC_00385]|uniref:hypothetical protein n=1 Tax=Streptomyces sp. NBC_00385 TaxID=2975733 RepID=UPI002DDC3723|nr:hypothetical protein [Streptomyces sp. NBC_00385]WRZ08831.1 hypothetical protein OG959_38570 [Streptomyces sp. NBC_00385]
MRRVMVYALFAAVGMATLSGCGAVVVPLVGVQLDAKEVPHLLLRPCGDDKIQGLALQGFAGINQAESGGLLDGENLSGWKVPGKKAPGDVDFPIFAPPSQWAAVHVGDQNLRTDLTYQVAFGKAEFNYEYTGLVTFRLTDVDALEPGQVWADGRSMTREAFEELAEESC